METEKGQSLLDVAIQSTGTIESLFEIAELNELSITDDLAAAQTVNVFVETSEGVLKDYFTNRKINSHVDTLPEKSGGIDYMGIQIDFKVS